MNLLLDFFTFSSFDHFGLKLEERQDKLQKQYFFKCCCIACQSPRKFPLISELKPRYSLSHLIEPSDDLQRVKQKYKSCCRFIQQIGRKEYSSYEVYITHIEAFFRCTKKFFVSNEY